MKFNGVEIRPEVIVQTRQWFADNAQACIDEVKSGAVRVNNPEEYFEWKESDKVDAMSGAFDHSLTFLQRAYSIQTGEFIALLA
jgi:hypothetical protein